VSDDGDHFAQRVASQVGRKLRARRAAARPVWSGLGMLGLIGWSVALPTLLGALLGQWLDRRHPGPHSWTLALLVAGLIFGCANACRWIFGEERAMREDDDA
jgi:ATP synthase protein I